MLTPGATTIELESLLLFCFVLSEKPVFFFHLFFFFQLVRVCVSVCAHVCLRGCALRLHRAEPVMCLFTEEGGGSNAHAASWDVLYRACQLLSLSPYRSLPPPPPTSFYLQLFFFFLPSSHPTIHCSNQHPPPLKKQRQ